MGKTPSFRLRKKTAAQETLKQRPAAKGIKICGKTADIFFKITAGHKGASVIFLCAFGGKSEILCVPKGHLWNAQRLCVEICNSMLECLMELPADGTWAAISDLVPDFRLTARAVRKEKLRQQQIVIAPVLQHEAQVENETSIDVD